MAEFGINQALAVDMGYDKRVNDLRFHEQQNQRALAENQAKQALFVDDLDYKNAANAYDNALIKDYATKAIKEIGSYVRENPDWETNIPKRMQINAMKKSLKDNEHVIRGLASDTAYKNYVGDLQEVAKNPQQHDTGAYDDISNQWNNYLNYGNQGGAEAAAKEGKKAFIYTKPKDFIDLPKALLSAGNSVKDYNVKKGNNIGEYWTEPKPEEVNAIKKSIYQQNGRQIEVEAAKLGLKTPEEIDNWVTQGISAGFNKHYSIGDPNAAFENGMRIKEFNERQNKPNAKEKAITETYTPFDNLVDPRNTAGTVSPDLLRKIWGDKPNIQVVGNNGAKADLTGLDMNYDTRFVKKKGITFLLGNVKIPLNEAINKGIVEQKTMFEDDDMSSGVKMNHKVKSDYLGKATIETGTNEKGEPYQYVKMDHQIPVNPNDQTARQMYNVLADVDKLVPASKSPYTGTQPKTVTQNGYTYTLNEKTGQYE